MFVVVGLNIGALQCTVWTLRYIHTAYTHRLLKVTPQKLLIFKKKQNTVHTHPFKVNCLKIHQSAF